VQPLTELGFCISCVLGSSKYSGVVPGVQPMSFHLVMRTYIKIVFMLSRDKEWGLLVSLYETST
jgi:hypothetical protein